MNTQRGVALITVLIIFGMGALLLIPLLDYTAAALRLFKASRDTISVQYAVDSITQQSVYMLGDPTLFKDCGNTTTGSTTPDGLVDSFSDCVVLRTSWTLATHNKLTGAFNETEVQTLNSQEVTVSVSVPGGLTAPPLPTPTPTSGQCFYPWLTRTPTWVKVGQPVTYTWWVASCSSNPSARNLRRMVVLADQHLTYVVLSSAVVGNVTLLDPQQTNCTGAAVDGGGAGLYFGCLANDNALLLDWPSGTTNLSGFALGPGDPPLKEQFQATPTTWGVFYVEPMVCYFASAAGNFGPCASINGVRGGKQAPVVVGMFNISGKGQGYAFGATAKLDSGGAALISQSPS